MTKHHRQIDRNGDKKIFFKTGKEGEKNKTKKLRTIKDEKKERQPFYGLVCDFVSVCLFVFHRFLFKGTSKTGHGCCHFVPDSLYVSVTS